MERLNIYLLAAGYNERTDRPCSLWSFNNGTSILDWQASVFKTVMPDSRLTVIVGYDFESIVARHPALAFSHTIDWRESSALHSFLEAKHDASMPAIAMYGDTVFHTDTLAAFTAQEGDIVVAVDSAWEQRFTGRSPQDIAIAETLELEPWGAVEYTGLIRFSAEVMGWILRHRHHYDASSSFPELIHDLEQAGFQLRSFDVCGDWAEMNEPNDLVHFILGSKAETLRRIKPQLQKSRVCDQITSLWSDWSQNPLAEVARIQARFNGQKVIVRSSSCEEDSWETANAGVFESILDIECDDTDALHKAVEAVFGSYGTRSPQEQVLIQPFVQNVEMSGVILTCDLVTGAPYYIINYDDLSGRTDSITSGMQDDLRTLIVFKQRAEIASQLDSRLKAVIAAAQELEQVLGYSRLDIEFALDREGALYTFQVRPIAVKHNLQQTDVKTIGAILNSARQQFERWQTAPPQIVGRSTCYSGMTDWNPAEIIGNRPDPLAVSLYNHIITEDIWARQRAECGYRDVRPAPLVHSFCAQPYVDCRASINSFIPAALPDELASRLVEVYLTILKESPGLHDKLELEVVFTIWVPTFWNDAKLRLAGRGLSTDDLVALEDALKQLTAQMLERLEADIHSLVVLVERLEAVSATSMGSIEACYQLIEDCKTYGTLAFSHAARAGFVAVTLLKSLVRMGGLTEARMLEFQASVPTVAGDLQVALADAEQGQDTLIAAYGHLRPGTYDVSQPAYWENPAFYLNQQPVSSTAFDSEAEFRFTADEKAAFQAVLDALPTRMCVDDFIQYLGAAIQAREQAKFEFSKNLSRALDLVVEYGEGTLNLARDEIGYLTFDDIRALRLGQLVEHQLHDLIKLRKGDWSERQLVKLPGFIGSINDLFGFEQEKSQANFITQLSVVAELVFSDELNPGDIDGRIIVIPNADPGFDWIFSHHIAGLITQYGGVNSHMAIRCAELGIPAAIGVGDKVYESLKAGAYRLDCYQGKLIHV